MKLLILVVVTSFMISGCGLSLFVPPIEDPVRVDYVGTIFGDRKTNVFSLTPERRIVLVVRKVAEGQTPGGIMVCAEPPSDVAQNIASSIKAAAEASAKDSSGKSAAFSTDLSKALSTSATSLFYRSQGVQLFRDGLYSLCQANMNGLVKNHEDFWEKYEALLNASFALIAQEIPMAQTLRAVDVANQVATTKIAVDAALQAAKEAQTAAE